MRTWSTAIRPNASAAADRNTNALTTIVEPSPPNPLSNSNTASMSDPEVAHLVHDHVAEDHPDAGDAQPQLGEVLIHDAGVELGRHHLQQEEDHDRQPEEKQCREFSFGGERADFAPHLEALADHTREALEKFAQVAAGRALDRYRRDQ